MQQVRNNETATQLAAGHIAAAPDSPSKMADGVLQLQKNLNTVLKSYAIAYSVLPDGMRIVYNDNKNYYYPKEAQRAMSYAALQEKYDKLIVECEELKTERDALQRELISVYQKAIDDNFDFLAEEAKREGTYNAEGLLVITKDDDWALEDEWDELYKEMNDESE